VELTPIEILQKESLNWRISEDMIHHILKTINLGKDANNVKGRLGEYFVAYHLNKTLRMHGFKQSYKAIPNSYTIRHLYRGHKGIDFYLRVIDKEGKVYKYLIEVANWKRLRYQMDFFYQDRIVPKFTQWDRLNRYDHVMCINHRNTQFIEEKAKSDGVSIIQLKEHYTPELIKKLIAEKQIDPYT